MSRERNDLENSNIPNHKKDDFYNYETFRNDPRNSWMNNSSQYFSNEKYNYFNRGQPSFNYMPFNPAVPPPFLSRNCDPQTDKFINYQTYLFNRQMAPEYNTPFGVDSFNKFSSIPQNPFSTAFFINKKTNQSSTKNKTKRTSQNSTRISSPQLDLSDTVLKKTSDIFDKVLGKKDSSKEDKGSEGTSSASKKRTRHHNDRNTISSSRATTHEKGRQSQKRDHLTDHYRTDNDNDNYIKDGTKEDDDSDKRRSSSKYDRNDSRSSKYDRNDSRSSNYDRNDSCDKNVKRKDNYERCERKEDITSSTAKPHTTKTTPVLSTSESCTRRTKADNNLGVKSKKMKRREEIKSIREAKRKAKNCKVAKDKKSKCTKGKNTNINKSSKSNNNDTSLIKTSIKSISDENVFSKNVATSLEKPLISKIKTVNKDAGSTVRHIIFGDEDVASKTISVNSQNKVSNIAPATSVPLDKNSAKKDSVLFSIKPQNISHFSTKITSLKSRLPKKPSESTKAANLSSSSSSITSSSSDEEFFNKRSTIKPSIKSVASLSTSLARGSDVAEKKSTVTQPAVAPQSSELIQEVSVVTLRKVFSDSQENQLFYKPLSPLALSDLPASLNLVELEPVEDAYPDVKEAINSVLNTPSFIQTNTLTNNKIDVKIKRENKKIVKKTTKKSVDKTATVLTTKKPKTLLKTKVKKGLAPNKANKKCDKVAAKEEIETSSPACNTAALPDTPSHYNAKDATINTNAEARKDSISLDQSNHSTQESTRADNTQGAVLQMCEREEEIYQQMQHIDHDVLHLQNVLNDVNHRLNMQKFYKDMLTSEAERLKNYRMQTLKDTVTFQKPASLSNQASILPESQTAGDVMLDPHPESVLVIQPTNKESSSSDSEFADGSYKKKIKRKRFGLGENQLSNQPLAGSMVETLNQKQVANQYISTTNPTKSSINPSSLSKKSSNTRNKLNSPLEAEVASEDKSHNVRYIGSVNSSNFSNNIFRNSSTSVYSQLTSNLIGDKDGLTMSKNSNIDNGKFNKVSIGANK